MSANRIVLVLSLGVLALVLAAVIYGGGEENQAFDGVIVMDVKVGGSNDVYTTWTDYEFYPNAKDCNYRGTPYWLVPNSSFRETVTTGSTDMDRLFLFQRGRHTRTWRAKLNGNLSGIGWHRYSGKTYWRMLSVIYVVDAVSINCGDAVLDWMNKDPNDQAGGAAFYQQVAIAYLAKASKDRARRDEWVKQAVAFYDKAFSVHQKNSVDLTSTPWGAVLN